MCFDTYGVRTDFHIPSFREGREEEYEFRSGHDFEQFMFGYYSTDFVTDFDYKSTAGTFPEELKRACAWAVKNKKTYSWLIKQKPEVFICYLYKEIKQNLPENLKSCLRVYVTVNTLLDFVYGVDVVFFLKGNYVTVDTTLDPFGKTKFRDNHLIFSHYSLSQRETNKFAKKVVKLLIKTEDE